MKRIIPLLLFFVYTLSYSQEKKISLNYQDEDVANVLSLIENQTDFRFFYMDSWLADQDKISGNYQDVEIKDILIEIFKDTVLNFYILDNRIILTKNESVYDYLPDQFFGLQRDTVITKTIRKTKKKVDLPVLSSNRNNSLSQKIETIRIGKRVQNDNKSEYEISGKLTNKVNNQPIKEALILINGTNKNIKSDGNGFYRLTLPPGSYNFEINALGMERYQKKIILYGDGTLNATISEKIEQLDAIFLEKKKDNNVEEVITKTEINVKESKNIPLALGERDVLRVATTLPGISTTGEGGIGYNVRGGKSDQNLILLDNAVVYSPQHFFGIFSALNPFVLDEANIFKNNIPAQYGGRLSSVFDLKTKDASVTKFKGEASIGPVTGNILLETPIVKDKSGFLIGGRGAYANYILESLDDEALQNSEASFYDIVAKYNHKIGDKSKIEITGYTSRDDFSITSDSLFIYNNRAFSLQWDYKFDAKNRGELIVSNSQYKFNIEFDGQSNDDFELGYDINESHLKLNFDYTYSDKIKFNYGLSNKLYNVNPGNIEPLNGDSSVAPLQIEKEKALETAGYIGAKIDITKEIKVDAGLRYSLYNALGAGTQNVYAPGAPRTEASITEVRNFENNEIMKTYNGAEYRIAGRYLFTPDFSLKASYNKSFQFIHSLSNNTTASPIDTWKLSDLNIKPQNSHQFSLGLYKNLKDDMYEISLEGFYKRLNNIVDFKTGAEVLLNENIETEVLQGKGKAYGVELLVKKQKGKLYGWLGYTYSRSFNKFQSPFSEEEINNGNFFPSNFDKPHDFSLVLNYKFTKRYSLSTNFVYQTGRPITYPVGQFNFNGAEFTVFSDRNEFRIPDFYRLDIGFNIEGNHKKKKLFHSFWTVSVYNVLGRNNPYSVFFVTEDGEVKGLQSSIFSIPVPSITYNFRF
ncbi:carboxypeptidase-like regulatory domain-containing protein [Aquimarina litoralis]|uniref:Carboxypeptidase-like regulatory domain-containing protein n=1 Tax=Aquimarina litoralis TaxID=584605 RepID=A0ABP3UGH4_9FLAO